ncbi:MAG: hypothetical protein A2428_14450 [Bdellovibrionales bacterium RIFOXYC1_FULL_54_43]|nr:MAG: hypothetical protein A2428_14450 [Bdellovibrionales bacterium RIFOXYC1_FULL_54_43]OFZ78334.1 MAG: hypothetical protein A2603_12410 [Bdellovibrionales bacterium RIFOXYD1_FULL_55_31]
MKWMLFSCGAMIGLTTLSVAMGSVPGRRANKITDDTAIYQSLSEIRVPRQGRINFDQDIARLSNIESGYRENLPALAKRPALQGPMKRIAQQKYHYSGGKRVARQ